MLALDDNGGTRPPVVLLHGVGLSREMWGAQVAALRPHYRVVAIDLPGHGDSPMPAADATLCDYADAVADTLVAIGIDRAVLIGFSMGALVARAMVLRHPERVSGMVLLNGVFARAPDVRSTILARVAKVAVHGPGANLDAAIERWFSPAFRERNVAYIADLRQRFAANDPGGYVTSYGLFASEDEYGAERLAEIRVPVLVATGESDVGSTPEMTRHLAARLPTAAARIVKGGRHMMPVEMPEETNALLLDFLANTEPQFSGEAR